MLPPQHRHRVIRNGLEMFPQIILQLRKTGLGDVVASGFMGGTDLGGGPLASARRPGTVIATLGLSSLTLPHPLRQRVHDPDNPMDLPQHELRQRPTAALAVAGVVAVESVGLLRRGRVPVHRLQRDEGEEEEELLVVGGACAAQDRGGLLQGCGVQV